MLAMKYEVIAEHRATFSYAIDLKRGDAITVTDRTEDGWVWCTTHDERGVWIPQTYLRQINHTATMLADYNSTELDVSIGDTLTGIIIESGWLFCFNTNGRNGWVPINNVKQIPE